MNVRNCRSCGRIFNYVSGPISCQICRERLEKKFQEVKEYIRANPGVGIPQVSEACEVEVSQIRQWLKDERLELTEDSPIRLACESCGDQIRSGKYCEKCKNDVTRGFSDILEAGKPKPLEPQKKKERDKEKMRFL